MIPIILQLIIIQYTLTITPVLSDCTIDPLEIQPTPVTSDTSGQIIYPNSRSRVAQINQNDHLLIACPGNNLLHNDIVIGEYIIAKCIEGSKFSFKEMEVDFYSLRCQDLPRNTIKYTEKNCGEGGQEIIIGYSVPEDNMFLTQIRICFDNINLSPIYSQFNLTSNIGYRQGRVPRKLFEEDGFYSTSNTLDSLYQRDNERKTINELLGLETHCETYITRNGETFINRGHLTAKGDFVYAFQQLATFHYVNSAPQWATFNAGNWNELEISLRQYADSTGSDLEVYTGVYGVTSLRNEKDGKKTELYLHTINGKKLMPVPQLFWKMIYDRKRYKGIVVLGVNNIYEFDPYEDVICDDTSEKLSWFNDKLRRQRRNVTLGFIYACTVPDFRRVADKCPDLAVRTPLL